MTSAAIVAAMACSTLVSCQSTIEPYDDKDIWEALNKLESRLNAIEAKVNENLAAIQSMISVGSIASCEFDAETGKAVIKLVDGRSITIDQNVKGISFMTVMEKDGKYYWALCKDGETSLLVINGKNVPVEVTPAAKISDEGEWMLSVDGGQTWVATGIFQPTEEEEKEDEKQEEEKEEEKEEDDNGPIETPDVVFFTDVTIEGNYLILTLVDGTQVKLEVVGEASFSAATTSVWFTRTSESKIVSLTMKNVKAFTITEKPEGWKAQISEENLVITSPEDFSAAETSGTIKILATFNGGINPEIVSVDVEYDEELSLEADSFGSMKVTVSEHVEEDYPGYIIKAWKKTEYSADAVVAWLNSEGYKTTAQTQSKTFDISELADNFQADQGYVVFVASYIPARMITSGSKQYTEADLITAEYFPIAVGIEVSNVRFDSATITASFAGINEYFAGITTTTDWDNYVKDNLIEMLGWGDMTAYTASSYRGEACNFPDGNDNITILPDTQYSVWMLEKTAKGMYKDSDFVIKTFKTPAVSADASISAPTHKITEVAFGGFTAEITPAANTYKTYAMIISDNMIPETDVETVNMLVKANQFSAGQEKLSVTSNSFNTDQNVYLISASLTENGKFGKILKEKVALRELVYSDAIGITGSTIKYGVGDVTMTLSFKGAPVSITYMVASYTYYSDEMIEKMLAMSQLGDVKDQKLSTLENGNELYISDLSIGTPYKLYAIVKDAEGNPSHLYISEFTPIIEADYILSSDADYSYGMPQLSGKWEGENTYILNITKPAECVKYWIYRGDPEYFTGDVWTDTDRLVSSQLYGVEVLTESVTGKTYTTMYSAARIYMAWLDDKGEYHAIYEFNPHQNK